MAQGFVRFYARGAAGRQPAGEERREQQRDRHQQEHPLIHDTDRHRRLRLDQRTSNDPDEEADGEALERSAAAIRADSESGPPEGVPAKRFLLLQDREGGRAIAVTLFETEDDYRQGDATLNEMSPPGEGMGQRVSVDKYEVAVEFEA